jgi:hypothetical protein
VRLPVLQSSANPSGGADARRLSEVAPAIRAGAQSARSPRGGGPGPLGAGGGPAPRGGPRPGDRRWRAAGRGLHGR